MSKTAVTLNLSTSSKQFKDRVVGDFWCSEYHVFIVVAGDVLCNLSNGTTYPSSETNVALKHVKSISFKPEF